MLITSIYTLTIFTSAFLLFLIQPMISKLLLPHLGGSPAVWNTAMLFFQVLLLLGYAYAHVSVRLLGARRQALAHIGLLAVSLLWIPLAAKMDVGIVSALHPVQWVMWSLALSVGVPFFALASNSPLMQSWLSNTTHKDAADPYFLYSASNIGSLLALFFYPFVMEPLCTLSQQALVWSAGFVLFALLSVACVAYLRTHYRDIAADGSQAQKPVLKQKLHWVFLAFCPSSLLLGVTTYITTDLASMPLFWVIPLAIYLLTFILAFARTPRMVGRSLSAQVLLVPLTIMVMLFDVKASLPLLLLHLLTFFTVAMGCHGTLSRHKPDARHLTEFFLWVSFGGMLGGVFNALLAPVVFSGPFEYPLLLILSLMLRPQLLPDTARRRVTDYLLPAGFMALAAGMAWAIGLWHTKDAVSNLVLQNHVLPVLLFIPLAASALLSQARPLRLALLVLALFMAVPIGNLMLGTADKGATLVWAERNFFGVNRLFKSESSGAMVLMHGTTLHGLQPLDKDKKMNLTTYFTVIPAAFNRLPEDLARKPVAILGLGAGTLACMGHKGQTFEFFEIDPAVASVASNPEYFSYLSNCPPAHKITLGDGRLEIARMEEGRYGFIIMDAFTSDAVPVHLVTREALAMYITRLAPGGMIAFNISNRHLRLAPLMAALARDAGLVALIKENRDIGDSKFLSASLWVVMARKTEDFYGLQQADPKWKPLENTHSFAVWTDNYSNLFQTLF